MRYDIYHGDRRVAEDLGYMATLERMHEFARSVNPEYATRKEIADALKGGFCGLARGSSVAPMVAIERKAEGRWVSPSRNRLGIL